MLDAKSFEFDLKCTLPAVDSCQNESDITTALGISFKLPTTVSSQYGKAPTELGIDPYERKKPEIAF